MKRIFVVILAVAVCLPALSGCVQEPDFYDVAVMPNGGEASPGLYQTTFDFDSYKEMIKAFREYDLSKSSYTIRDLIPLLGESYLAFVDRVRADKAFPQPVRGDEPIELRNEDGFSNITFFVSELYGLPWMYPRARIFILSSRICPIALTALSRHPRLSRSYPRIRRTSEISASVTKVFITDRSSSATARSRHSFANTMTIPEAALLSFTATCL